MTYSPTHERLHRIKLAPTDRCTQCGQQDTIQHRLIECAEGTVTWEWTKQRIATMLRTDPRHTPAEWLLRPHFKLWPPKRHRAILWTLANLALYRLQRQLLLTLQDYIDFRRRAKWKKYQRTGRLNIVGNYPETL
jgi:hypothetical protein